MNNPYQSPDSDVQVPEVISKTKWKVFFWLLLGLQVLSVALGIADDTESVYDLVFDVVVYTVILLGVFGYAFNKRFFTQNFWKRVIPVAIAYDVYYIFIDDPWSFESTEEMYFVIAAMVVILFPLIVFQYLVLYRYAFKSDEVWKRNT